MLVIWNPNAGSVEAAAEVRRELSRRPHTTVQETRCGEEAIELVATRIAAGEDRIVAAGGDGTVNAVINGMMQSPNEAELGVLPLGTANDWCSSLDVPNSLEQALALIDRWHVLPMDIIELVTPDACQYYANIATGGNSHRVTESITPELKKTWGALCYLRGAIGILADLKTFTARISFDQQAPESFDVWNIIVANGRTSAGRLTVAPKALINDGLLDVVVVRDGTLLDLAGMTLQLLASDRYIESDQVEYRQARSISIESDPPILFSIDGDLVKRQPLRFQTHAGAIRVVVGSDYFGE